MNCPSHYLHLSAPGSTATASCRCGIATYDVLHRNEVSGALSGLTRVRQFQQDDCHVFLMGSQIADEVRGSTEFILGFYATFGLTATLKFATRPEQRIGDDAMWDRAEAALRAALEATGCPTSSSRATARSTAPRSTSTWPTRSAGSGSSAPSSSTTLRPSGSSSIYVGEDNAEHRPVVIHRADVRLVRAVHGDSDRALRRRVPGLARAGAGAGAPDLRRAARGGPRGRRRGSRPRASAPTSTTGNETLNYRIRDGEVHKVPYMAIDRPARGRDATAWRCGCAGRGRSRR